MNRPLSSAKASMKYIVELARSERAKLGIDMPSAKAKVAAMYNLDNWRDFESIVQRCGELVYPNAIQYTRTLNTNLQHAWQLITNQEHLSTWMFETKLELKVGGAFEFPTWKGTISRLEDLHCIRFTAEAGGYSQFEISPDGENRTVTRIIDYLPEGMLVPDHLTQGSEVFGMTQHGGPGTHWAGLLAGWHSGSDSLAAYASNKESSGDYMSLVRLYDALLIARYQN